MNRKTGVLLSYVLMIFEVISTLLLTPFIIRTLGQAEFGVYKLSSAVTAYLLLLDLGVGNAVTRYIAKYHINCDKVGERKFLGIAIIFYIIIAILALVIGVVLVNIFPQLFSKGLTLKEVILCQKLLGITIINAAVTLGTAAFTNVLIAYEKFAVSRFASIIQIILRMIFTYIVLKMGLGSLGIVSVNLLMTLLCRGFFIVYVIVYLKLTPLFHDIQPYLIKEIVTYSSLIMIQMIATQLNGTIDQILIGALVASSSVILAVYGVGAQIVQYFQQIGSAFTSVLMPGIVKLVETDSSVNKLTNEMIRISRIIFMVLIIIWSGFFVQGKQFIVLWAGEANKQAYIVGIILMTVYLFTITESVGNQLLWAMNMHKEQALLKLIIVLINIVLTVVLIKWNPIIGATIGTFISIFLGDVVLMNVVFVKKIHLDLLCYYKELFKGIVPAALCSIIIGLIVAHFINGNWLALIFNILIMVLAYILLLYFYGMNRYEKTLLVSLKNKYKKKNNNKNSK